MTRLETYPIYKKHITTNKPIYRYMYSIGMKQNTSNQIPKTVGNNISPLYHEDPLRAEYLEAQNFYMRGELTWDQYIQRLDELKKVSGLDRMGLYKRYIIG